MAWVAIPGGTFMMGSGAGDEGPRHQVRVQAFLMAQTLVTNKQYQACVDAGACEAVDNNCGKLSEDNHPVTGVDWNNAKAFSEWVGGRLPSEAEWEYAARSAGKDYKYPWGNADAACARAVINEGGHGCGRDATWPVCSQAAGNTDQGLCDMASNVWEWVQDWYHDSYDGAPANGSAWESPNGSSRVLRGGPWAYFGGSARAAHRRVDPGGRYNFLGGFRPVW